VKVERETPAAPVPEQSGPSTEPADPNASEGGAGSSPWIPSLGRARAVLSAPNLDAFVHFRRRAKAAPSVPRQDAEQILRLSPEALAGSSVEERIAWLRALLHGPTSSSPGEDGADRARRERGEAVVRIFETARDPVTFGRLYYGAPPEAVRGALDSQSAKSVEELKRSYAAKRGHWADFLSYLDGVAEIASSGRNALDFLIDGPAAFQAIEQAISQAKTSINVSTYIWQADDAGWRMAQALASKAALGIPVRVLLDKYGSPPKSSKLAQQIAFMKAHGVEVRTNEVGLFAGHLNHRKMIVVDGSVGFMGGMNVGRSALQWHDQMTRIAGAAVTELQDAFLDRWTASGAALSEPEEQRLYPPLGDVSGGAETRIVAGVGHADRRIQAMYLRAIETAQTSIRIANPYITDADVVNALCDAAKKKVKVQLVIPRDNDVPMALHAARGFYRQLLKAGVEIYEYKGRMAHEKVATMDGVFAAFGSANLDQRSFRNNDELDAVVMDQAFAADVDRRLFDVDLANSERITEHHATLLEEVDKMLRGLL
jgi:cardiolipin synthase